MPLEPDHRTETGDMLEGNKRWHQHPAAPAGESQLPDQKVRMRMGGESARARWQSAGEKLINSPVSAFVIQLLCILLILFALARIATSARWLSLPWIEEWGELNIGYVPWEVLLIIMGIAGIIVISLRNRGSRTTLPISSAMAVLSIGILLAVPQIREVVFWQGMNGERMEAYVKLEAVPYDDSAVVVGAKGNRIWLHNNPKAKNPTFHELEQFLLIDKTDEIQYNQDTFNCADYAEMLHNNAERAGLRSAYVVVGLSESGHALNAFDTIDRGLIYIDNTGTSGYYPCSADKVVVVKVGQPYVPRSMVPCPPFDPAWHNMGTVASIHIQW